MLCLLSCCARATVSDALLVGPLPVLRPGRCYTVARSHRVVSSFKCRVGTLSLSSDGLVASRSLQAWYLFFLCRKVRIANCGKLVHTSSDSACRSASQQCAVWPHYTLTPPAPPPATPAKTTVGRRNVLCVSLRHSG